MHPFAVLSQLQAKSRSQVAGAFNAYAARLRQILKARRQNPGGPADLVRPPSQYVLEC